MSDKKDNKNNKNNIISLAVSNDKINKDESHDLFSDTVSSYLERYKLTDKPGASLLIWYDDPMDPDSLKMAVNTEDIPLLHFTTSRITKHLLDTDFGDHFEFEPEPDIDPES